MKFSSRVPRLPARIQLRITRTGDVSGLHVAESAAASRTMDRVLGKKALFWGTRRHMASPHRPDPAAPERSGHERCPLRARGSRNGGNAQPQDRGRCDRVRLVGVGEARLTTPCDVTLCGSLKYKKVKLAWFTHKNSYDKNVQQKCALHALHRTQKRVQSPRVQRSPGWCVRRIARA